MRGVTPRSGFVQQSIQHELRNAVTRFAKTRKTTAIITTPVNAALNLRLSQPIERLLSIPGYGGSRSISVLQVRRLAFPLGLSRRQLKNTHQNGHCPASDGHPLL